MAGGRPSRYKAEYAEQAYKFSLLGATDARLAEFFEVAESTINMWKSTHPEFSESIKEGKQRADAQVAQSLFKRATGYQYEEITYEGEDSTLAKKVVKEVAPDTGAAMAWLKNRQPKDWRDKQEVEHSGQVSIESLLRKL